MQSSTLRRELDRDEKEHDRLKLIGSGDRLASFGPEVEQMAELISRNQARFGERCGSMLMMNELKCLNGKLHELREQIEEVMSEESLNVNTDGTAVLLEVCLASHCL